MPPLLPRRSTVVSTAWFRAKTTIITLLTTITTTRVKKISKTSALLLATILVIVVVLVWQTWQIATIPNSERHGRVRTNHHHGSRVDLLAFCPSTRRCQPIHADRDRISYLHISKNSGSSWIQEFKRIKNISTDLEGGPETFLQVGLYPTKHGDDEHSYAYQEALLQNYSLGQSSPPYQRFLTLRSPRHHVWSLFSQCYFSKWGILETLHTQFPRNHPDHVLKDFQSWLDHFVSLDTHKIRRQPDAYHCYHPANYQARALSSRGAENPHTVVDNIYEPNPTIVNQTYWAMDWVSLTSFFHESKCILYHRIHKAGDSTSKSPLIQKYLEQTCHCRIQEQKESHQELHSLKDVKDTHYNLSSHDRPAVKDFPLDILQRIDILTRVDRFLYTMALQQFVKEIVWVESERQQRILCDTVLDQWEKELNYLEFNIKTAYFALRRARNLDKRVS